MPRKSHLGRWDVHFVASQDAVGVLLGPQVVVLRGGFLGSAWLDPTHLNGMNQLPDLIERERDGCSDGTVERKHTHSNTSLWLLRAHVYDHYSKHSLHTSPVYSRKRITYSDRNQPEYLKRESYFNRNVCRFDFFQRPISDPHYAGISDLFPL